MTKFNYKIISEDLLKDLPKRNRDIITRRFGFTGKNLVNNKQKETLESIGKHYGITRERVRQIEKDTMDRIKKNSESITQKPFQYFIQELNSFGGLKKEDLLLERLGGKENKPHVLFLLTLGDQFKRVSETDDIHALWTINSNSLDKAKKTIASLKSDLNKNSKPMAFKDFNTSGLNSNAKASYVEVSKYIMKSEAGLYGFPTWSEINPRGIKDKAFLTLKREGKPLHFTILADLIQKQKKNRKSSLVKTVHNELIKDHRFVLVGRGLYALQEWGYESGCVKDVISHVLQNNQKALSKDEVIKEVLKQRFVKENTIFLNLNNKKYFFKNNQGRYIIRQD